MEWIHSLFIIPSAIQAIILIGLICSIGLSLGKIKIGGISLGIAFVFFTGIFIGHLGFSADEHMLAYCETFGLVLFVYTLGLQVGPNFFGAFRHEGMIQNICSLGVILFGTFIAVILSFITPISMTDMVGVLSGATTNTPALGAAQQALEHIGISSGSAALATAVTYPLGVIGVIFALAIMKKFFVHPADLEPHHNTEDNQTFVGEFQIANAMLDNKTISSIAQESHDKFIISRVWRGSEVIIPQANTILRLGDHILVVTNKDEVKALEMLFGQYLLKDWNREEVDWNHLDTKMESRIIVLTRTALNGKKLGNLCLRHTCSVNVSRITRGDIKLLATNNLRLQYGDRLTVVGEPKALDEAEQLLGNSVKTLEEPNIGAIFLGMILGLAIGTIPFTLPGMDSPIRLGIAGGGIIMGIIVGALGSRMRLISYTTRSASLMLRKLGLTLYLACIGLKAGCHFMDTVVRPEGLMWIGTGFLITLIPILLIGYLTLRTHKFDYGTICGILCGAMANPMALTYANDTLQGDSASVSYATVYPLSMLLRVIIAQMLVMFFS